MIDPEEIRERAIGSMAAMIEVNKEDGENYCRILAVLGMEEEGDPVAEVERMDKELDIVHEALTELYNLDAAVPIIKAALARIDALKTPNDLAKPPGAALCARSA